MPAKYYLIIFFAISLSGNSFSQDKSELLRYSGIIQPEILISTDKDLDIDDILEDAYQLKFAPVSRKIPMFPHKVYWFKIDFSDIDLAIMEKWLIRFYKYDQITLFYLNEDSISSIDQTEKYNSSSDNLYTEFLFTKENLFQERLLYARIMHNTRYFNRWHVAYMNPLASELGSYYYSKKVFSQQIVYIMFIGGMLLIITYFFGIYFLYKDKMFLIYLLYLFSLLLYLGTKAAFIEMPLRNYFGPYFSYFHELIQVVVNIFYLIFASHFLKARTDFPKLNVAIRYMVKALLVIMAIQVALMLTERYFYLEEYVMHFERFFVILFSFWAYYHIIRGYKDRLAFFLLAGSFVYIIGGLSALMFREVAFMMVGSAIEVFFFSLGMGYRMKKIEEENKWRESELMRMELTALKAQMNPHFIFNSLNSIRAYVIANKVKEASAYITKFAKLIRLILQYSAKEFITLQEDIEALQLYVELEELRFRDNFGLEVTVSNEIESGSLFLPPLILQPYVENAIRHGLAPKSGDKKLQITIYPEKDCIVFKIKDNGVGRQHSHKNKTVITGHQSIAMELTKKRINLTGKLYATEGNVIINDLIENGLASGTEVILRLTLSSSKNK